MTPEINRSNKNGLQAIGEMFAQASSENRAAFLPYFPIGYPDYETSLEIVQAMANAGVDAFEIGMPFSDPLADGPTIQAATQIALQNKITVRKCLEAVKELRQGGVSQPILMMGYLNPILAYGIEAFVNHAREAGADGLIIPDLPPEEAQQALDACRSEGLALVFFLAPTSTEERIKVVASQASGFIYLVALTGVTGARTELPAYLTEFIARVRRHTGQPLVLGFGISQPEHARAMNELVDGFIVGSALVKAAEGGVLAVAELSSTLRQALNN